jgi:hypothetical protein
MVAVICRAFVENPTSTGLPEFRGRASRVFRLTLGELTAGQRSCRSSPVECGHSRLRKCVQCREREGPAWHDSPESACGAVRRWRARRVTPGRVDESRSGVHSRSFRGSPATRGNRVQGPDVVGERLACAVATALCLLHRRGARNGRYRSPGCGPFGHLDVRRGQPSAMRARMRAIRSMGSFRSSALSSSTRHPSASSFERLVMSDRHCPFVVRW